MLFLENYADVKQIRSIALLQSTPTCGSELLRKETVVGKQTF